MDSNFYIAGLVKRFHTWPTVNQQTVASHTFGVVQILLRIWPRSSRNAILYALDHDMGEWFAGDVQATAKWANPVLKSELERIEVKAAEYIGSTLPELDELEALRVKLCDYLELLMFAAHEIEMGNQYMRTPFQNIHEALDRMKEKIPSEDWECIVKFRTEYRLYDILIRK